MGDKRGFRVALCAFADEMTLPVLIIFKERGGKFLDRVRAAIKCPEMLKVTATTNGWMTMEKLLLWIRGMQKMERIDHHKPHYAADTLSLLTILDTDYVYIPAGCIGIAQPMDVSINAPSKRKIVYLWVEWCRLPAAHTPAHNFKQPTRQQVI